MKLVFLILCLIVVAPAGWTQERLFRAFIKASEDFEPLSEVQIRDVQTGKIVRSDKDGFFEIRTHVGHTLELSRTSIKAQKIELKASMFNAIQQLILRYDIRELSEVLVLERTKYQIDSAERYETYQQDLERKKERVRVTEIAPTRQGFGIVLDNPVSSWMQYVAPKSKNRLRFQKNFAEWEQQKYIDQKYTRERVAALTGLQNDSLAWFMNAYPLPYAMARTASKDQIDVWIKANLESWNRDARVLIRKMKIEDWE